MATPSLSKFWSEVDELQEQIEEPVTVFQDELGMFAAARLGKDTCENAYIIHAHYNTFTRKYDKPISLSFDSRSVELLKQLWK